ncbi:hypothetical protein [Staphylococcus gallinarum]|uniref:hypothetical protein n=1 Tax=Staphylococcus gallinarum TaxID=1293 RepID=UPI000E67FCB8|nr:hypothetical protein [Staphylococcus gallinarum]RIL23396.1 hypothetical protein BUY99_05250 [Staphylococcus gallinarum]
MKFIYFIKKKACEYKKKYIEPPAKEKYAHLKEMDEILYKQRVKEEIGRIIAKQIVLPTTIITIALAYAIIYYSYQFFQYLGGL